MKKILIFAVTSLAFMLCGCPSKTQQNVAQAALTASSTIQAAQQAEIAAYLNGKSCASTAGASCVVISDEDHKFIQTQFVSVSAVGKTLDSCIRTATNTAGSLICINTASATITQINNNGGLYIKSAEARKDFQAAMSALNLSLTVLTQVLGGK